MIPQPALKELLASLGVPYQKVPPSLQPALLNKLLRHAPTPVPAPVGLSFHGLLSWGDLGDDGGPVSLFVPLGSTDSLSYAHWKVQARGFGEACLTPTSALAPYATIDALALRPDSLFGAHVTLSGGRKPADWQATSAPNAEPVGPPPVTDLHVRLVLLLLGAVLDHSPDPSDCFLAAYYAYELSIAYNEGFLQDPVDDQTDDVLEQAVKFGNDGVILRLVVSAAKWMDHLDVTVKGFFILESIVCFAKEEVCKESS
eukprot:TRINITY_DN10032_c0_g1_i1.p1 TRINITY_DN10032_c0_g1~~TRINITY_DN10032_c0_g1_i1.p1  ORF type:complete len:257 (-),score=37.14 TRINITY_DN10032_c0_g1_i1:179-949(-)